MSSAAALTSPKRRRMAAAPVGSSASGVTVEKMTRSISSGAMRRAAQPSSSQPSACRAAHSARSTFVSFTHTRRERMPVRVEIHSSLVSTSFDSSSLATSSFGSFLPQPMMVQPMMLLRKSEAKRPENDAVSNAPEYSTGPQGARESSRLLEKRTGISAQVKQEPRQAAAFWPDSAHGDARLPQSARGRYTCRSWRLSTSSHARAKALTAKHRQQVLRTAQSKRVCD